MIVTALCRGLCILQPHCMLHKCRRALSEHRLVQWYNAVEDGIVLPHGHLRPYRTAPAPSLFFFAASAAHSPSLAQVQPASNLVTSCIPHSRCHHVCTASTPPCAARKGCRCCSASLRLSMYRVRNHQHFYTMINHCYTMKLPARRCSFTARGALGCKHMQC